MSTPEGGLPPEITQGEQNHPLRRGILVGAEAVGGRIFGGATGLAFNAAVGIAAPPVLIGEVLLGAILVPLLIAQAEGRQE